MRHIRFNHVFAVLMIVAFATAFLLPRQTTRNKPQLQVLFLPVARPASMIGNWFRGRVEPAKVEDNRPLDDVRLENDSLRIALANLSEQLQLLKRINADRELLGHARELCTPVRVVGGDASPGTRETLELGMASGIRQDDAVLYPEGIAGRISYVGTGGSMVRLITDKEFALTGTFCRYERSAEAGLRLVKIATPPALVTGVGQNGMIVNNLLTKTIEDAKIAIGDWIILDDATWPETLRGYRVGKVVSIDKRPEKPLYALIRVEPQGALARLREVMVMNKTALEAQPTDTQRTMAND